MLDSITSHDIEITLQIAILALNVKSLPSFTQRYNRGHYVTLWNLKTTSVSSILFQGVIYPAIYCRKQFDITNYVTFR